MTIWPAHNTLPLGGLLRDLAPDGNPDQTGGWWCDSNRGVFGWAADPAAGQDACCDRACHALTDDRLASTTENDVFDLINIEYHANQPATARLSSVMVLIGTLWLLAHHDDGLGLADRLARRGLLGTMPLLPARPQDRPDQEASRVACAIRDGWATSGTLNPYSPLISASLVWSTVTALVAAGVGRRVAAAWSRDGTLDPDAAKALVAGDPAVTGWIPFGRSAGLWRAAGFDSRSATKVAAVRPGDPGSCSKDQLVVMAALRETPLTQVGLVVRKGS